MFFQLGSDSENEGESTGESPVTREKRVLITHPARRCVFEFLRVIVTDSLTCNLSSKGSAVIDAVLEVRIRRNLAAGTWSCLVERKHLSAGNENRKFCTCTSAWILPNHISYNNNYKQQWQ